MTFAPTLTNVSPSTIFMMEYFSDQEMLGVPTGFQSDFGNTANGSKNDFVWDSLQFTHDIVRGNRLTSKAFPRIVYPGGWDLGTETSSFKGEKFRNITRYFPIIPEYFNIGFAETFNRVPGENPIETISSSARMTERLRYRFAEGLMAAMKRIIRKKELMAYESIETSTITLDDTAASQYSFERSTGIALTANPVWSNASATCIQDIDTVYDRIRDRSGRGPNHIRMGSTSFAEFTTRLLTTADNRGYMFVRAGADSVLPTLPADLQRLVNNGFMYVGWVQTYKGRKLPIFTYDQSYESSAGTYAEVIGAEKVILGNTMARNDLVHGPRITFPNNTFHEQALNQLLGFDAFNAGAYQPEGTGGIFDPMQYHIDGKVNDDNDAIAVRIISGPVYVNTECDAWGVIST